MTWDATNNKWQTTDPNLWATSVHAGDNPVLVEQYSQHHLPRRVMVDLRSADRGRVSCSRTSRLSRRAGLALYDALHNEYSMIALTANTSEIASWWLNREFLRGWAGVMTMPDAYSNYGDWKVKQVEEFLAEGWEVGMVIDTVEEVLERISHLGVLTLLLSYPTNRVGWRDPTPEVRAWTDVVSDLG
jgi:hypothetical protein